MVSGFLSLGSRISLFRISLFSHSEGKTENESYVVYAELPADVSDTEGTGQVDYRGKYV